LSKVCVLAADLWTDELGQAGEIMIETIMWSLAAAALWVGIYLGITFINGGPLF
jgi:hypothetical protein